MEDESLMPITIYERLAVYLHNHYCHYSHADYCSWHYEKNWNDYAHNQYVEDAKQIIKTWNSILGSSR